MQGVCIRIFALLKNCAIHHVISTMSYLLTNNSLMYVAFLICGLQVKTSLNLVFMNNSHINRLSLVL